jgi:CheY-like chemotaxis protein
MDKKPHILIVEDSPIAQAVLKTQMVNQGCTVDVASDGTSALSMAIKTPYDVILMDIGLGDGPDGFEVTVDIKNKSQINKATPVMAVTAHGEPTFQDKAISIGMVGYFNKPFTPEDAKKILDFLYDKK